MRLREKNDVTNSPGGTWILGRWVYSQWRPGKHPGMGANVPSSPGCVAGAKCQGTGSLAAFLLSPVVSALGPLPCPSFPPLQVDEVVLPPPGLWAGPRRTRWIFHGPWLTAAKDLLGVWRPQLVKERGAGGGEGRGGRQSPAIDQSGPLYADKTLCTQLPRQRGL